jgi:hypothetical protein
MAFRARGKMGDTRNTFFVDPDGPIMNYADYYERSEEVRTAQGIQDEPYQWPLPLSARVDKAPDPPREKWRDERDAFCGRMQRRRQRTSLFKIVFAFALAALLLLGLITGILPSGGILAGAWPPTRGVVVMTMFLFIIIYVANQK